MMLSLVLTGALLVPTAEQSLDRPRDNGLRQVLQQGTAADAAPRQLTAAQRAELRRQLGAYSRPVSPPSKPQYAHGTP